MMETERASETLDYSSILTWLVAWEDFIATVMMMMMMIINTRRKEKIFAIQKVLDILLRLFFRIDEYNMIFNYILHTL
jgi:hypothetical protein